MKVEVHFRDTQTGETGIHRDGYDWPKPENMEQMYAQGNFSCDCNRQAFFHRSRGGEVGTWKCGTSRYVIDRIVEQGRKRVLYEEKGRNPNHRRVLCSHQ